MGAELSKEASGPEQADPRRHKRLSTRGTRRAFLAKRLSGFCAFCGFCVVRRRLHEDFRNVYLMRTFVGAAGAVVLAPDLYSYAPTSKAPPCGRVTPSASVETALTD